jgi:hypothetical protein
MVAIDADKAITNIDIAEIKKTQNRAKAQVGEFNAIFQQARDAKDVNPTETQSTSFLGGIRPARFTAETETAPSTNMIADQVEQLIDTMEAYQQKLIDNDATLKEIQPLMDKMASHHERLSAISKGVDDQEKLGAVVNQSLMLSSMEMTRYNSGFYND